MGWSCRVDKSLAKYAELSYEKFYNDYIDICKESNDDIDLDKINLNAHVYAEKKTRKDINQGFQGLEHKLNSVASSRGDFVFVTFALGLDNSIFGKMISEECLRTRMKGHGKNGFKTPVVFPKLVFLYDEEMHGVNKPHSDLFDLACECSSKCMYPDFLSLTGEGYVPSIYKEYKEVVYPMG